MPQRIESCLMRYLRSIQIPRAKGQTVFTVEEALKGSQ